MLNSVVIMGRLTADPELKQTNSGVATVRFTVAVDRTFVPQGQERQADFITVVAWRQTAEFVSRFFHKGSMVCVEGSLRTSSYDDKNYPGVKHYVTEVFANQVHFTGERAQNGQGNYAPYGGQPVQPSYAQPAYQNSQGGYPAQQSYAPQAPVPTPAPAPAVSVGGFDDFEEVISDSDLPF